MDFATMSQTQMFIALEYFYFSATCLGVVPSHLSKESLLGAPWN